MYLIPHSGSCYPACVQYCIAGNFKRANFHEFLQLNGLLQKFSPQNFWQATPTCMIIVIHTDPQKFSPSKVSHCMILPCTGKILRASISHMVNLYHFVGLIFADMHNHAHYIYVLYKWANFTDLIFAVKWSSVKTAKIGPLENFPLCGTRNLVIGQCVYTRHESGGGIN